MRNLILTTLILCIVAAAADAEKAVVKTFAINEYFGIDYENEPVSTDVTFDSPVKLEDISASPGPYQVEVLDGTPQAVKKARVWMLVSFEQRGQILGHVLHGGKGKEKQPETPLKVNKAGSVGQVEIAELSNDAFACKVPVGSVTFDVPVSAFEVPGPVVSVSRDGKNWIGSGYLDSMLRVKSIECEQQAGPVFVESKITYNFEQGKKYVARVRVFAGKPYARIVSDFNLGGASKYVFNYDDWKADGFFDLGDSNSGKWIHPIKTSNPCGDFIQVEGQKALARLVIWNQHNYFAGKQHTIGLKAPSAEAQAAIEKDDKYQWQTSRKDRKTKEMVTTTHTITPQDFPFSGTVYRTMSDTTPVRDETAVGGFFIRPDRWTRAKVNHVDLYLRPEVPGDRMTRGVVGLKGAKARFAMEAWLVDGHREWAIYAAPAGKKYEKSYGVNDWLQTAKTKEGVWPLDRINRMTLVWNADGSPVKPEHTAPTGDPAHGGGARSVIIGTRGRSGLMYFNGSNGHIRGSMGSGGYVKWAEENRNVTAAELAKAGQTSQKMVGWAMMAYMCMDESAYPGTRAMLPWSHPEALNPFYQGMENMNFNADRYRLVSMLGEGLMLAGHPDGEKIFLHGQQQMDMALDRYVYPQSGCWEESHGYCGHTLHNLLPLVKILNRRNKRDFFNDPRFANLMGFWVYAHSPRDPDFGKLRIPPPIGDHGLGVGKFSRYFKDSVGYFAESKNPKVRETAANMAFMLPQIGGAVPADVKITPRKPDLTSRWMQGYGSTMRGFGRAREVVNIRLHGAIARKVKNKIVPRDLIIQATLERGRITGEVTGQSPEFNQAQHDGTIRTGSSEGTYAIDMNVNSDRWVKGGKGSYELKLDAPISKADGGTFTGTFEGEQVEGKLTIRSYAQPEESYLVLRAGQSWGHHHMDKGSMWFWGRNVHFFGDAAWGGPPGGTYGNYYKQGPASGTQIELHGVTNWTLPCKYAAPWISDEEYAGTFDYANARCMFPFNPRLDLSESTPVALRNGYDRQTLFIHPDIVVVRDNVETMCPTTWRMHSYQPDRTRVDGNTAILASEHGVTGKLTMLHPKDTKLSLVKQHPEGKDFGSKKNRKTGADTRSEMLKWDMPDNTSATWVFSVSGEKETPARIRRLDADGKVTEISTGGRKYIVLMNIHPFTYAGEWGSFTGSVGLVEIDGDGKPVFRAIRGKFDSEK